MSDLTHTGFVRAIKKLDSETQKVGAVLEERARMLKEIGEDTAAVAEMIGEMRIDTPTVEECRSLAVECGALNEGYAKFLNHLHDVQRVSEVMRETAAREDGAIQEAVDASNIQGVHDIDRLWFKQD
ncbi:hypothetical protein E1265_32240 [Streptomyces sp. 8K308]|uniref:hypothetical protein n=1 Tax=Streptomyces sp. 8K308 TaxID=2530388 RepID=UPI001047676D|nr:hypothetical protein [Streptomyces sp. 8K308]TDC09412.1 hypothetical protein E1265_32240 [Streptomyces sp. 8K308]